MARRLRNQVRIASTSKIGSLNDLKNIARNFDTLARAQYVAGVLGDPVSAVREPQKYLISAISRLNNLNAPPSHIEDWTGRQNKDTLGQSASSIYNFLGDSDWVGVTSEDVLTSVVTGLSPITSGPIWGGNPLPYKLGLDSDGQLYPLPATAKIIGENAGFLANDVRKSANKKKEESHDVMVDESESKERMIDVLEHELYEGRGTMADMLFDPKNLRLVAPYVRLGIKNELTQQIWDLIVESGGALLKPGKGGVGVSIKPVETAEAYARTFGRTIDPNTLGRNFRNNEEEVTTLIAEAFTDSDVSDRIQFTKDLEELLYEERTKHRHWKGRAANSRNRYASDGVELLEGKEEVICDSNAMSCEGVLRFKRGGKPIPTSVMLRGYIIGIAVAQNDVEIAKKYGFDVLDNLDRVIRGWLRTAEKNPEYTLSAGQKKWLNSALGGQTPRGLSETIRKAVIRECSLVGGCDLPDQSRFRFGQLADKFASIRKRHS